MQHQKNLNLDRLTVRKVVLFRMRKFVNITQIERNVSGQYNRQKSTPHTKCYFMYTIEEAFSTTHISTFNRKRSTWADKVLTVKHIIDKYWYSSVL